MMFTLEYKKVKRTGFLAACLGGGFLAAFVPVLNMAFRTEAYVNIAAPPLQILLDANWQMVSMLNILLVVIGACILYHTEYADNAIQRMKSLPVKEGSLFFGKSVVMLTVVLMVLVMEGAAFLFCSMYWFRDAGDVYMELIKNVGFFLILMLPAVLLALVISSVCKNMWTSLGIGVVCVFTATMLPAKNFVLSLFPFALPFQILTGSGDQRIVQYIVSAAAESAVIAGIGLLFFKIRRYFE